jgi:hypothetical protein
MIASHDQFLDAMEAGYVLTGDALREWAASDSDDIDEFLEAYSGDDGGGTAQEGAPADIGARTEDANRDDASPEDPNPDDDADPGRTSP